MFSMTMFVKDDRKKKLQLIPWATLVFKYLAHGSSNSTVFGDGDLNAGAEDVMVAACPRFVWRFIIN